MQVPGSPAAPLLGRYVLHDEIASGGMATVHLGRLLGPAGFSKTVAIKRLHPQMSKDPDFVSMFLDEARLASRIQHPNAVATLDVIAEQDELFLVMEYIQGESLSRLLRSSVERGFVLEPGIMNTVLAGALHGLHAAHEARDARGEPLHIVHRDISPQNILVGTDGVARVLDFGVAKAAMRLQTTREGKMKGKIAYMAPEQLRAEEVDRRADVFAAGIVHWEALTGRRLFSGGDVGEVINKVLNAPIMPPSALMPDIGEDLDGVVMRALERNAEKRYATAREYAIAIENCGPMVLARLVGDWVSKVGGDALSLRSEKVAMVEKLTAEHDFSTDEKIVEARARLQADPRAFTARRVVSAPTLPAPDQDELVTVAARPNPESASGVTTRPRSKLPFALGAGAVLTATLAWALSGKNEGGDPGPALSQASSVSPAPAASPAVTAASTAAAPPAASEAAPAVSAATSAARSTAPRTAVKPKRTNCDPPYTIDSRGIRRVKPGCR